MGLDSATRTRLESLAKQIRRDIIVETFNAGSGHPGSSLSATDIITYFYFHKLRHRPTEPKWSDRDRFVLSKGHACPALYAALAEAGYFPKELLLTLRKFGSPLQGHPRSDMAPWIEVSSGSLGHGFAAANGMALVGKLDNASYRIYALLGDGECDEGEVWETAMSAANYKLDNLTIFIDRNGLQIDGPTEEIMKLEPLADKWRAFGWHVIEIDGNNLDQIDAAVSEAEQTKGKPTAIIAHTVKGKGVSFMENSLHFHGNAPNKEEYEKAMKELA